MKETHARILERIKAVEQSLDPFHRKVHKLRRLTLGDASAINDSGGAIDSGADGVSRPNESNFYDILVTDYTEGRSNLLLRLVRTLALQVSFHFPEFEFTTLDPEFAMVNSGYLASRLGPPHEGCDAKRHLLRALYDYLTGGMGIVFTGTGAMGKPVVRQMDTLRFKWDQTAPSIEEARWQSVSITHCLKYWEEFFQKGAFDKYRSSRTGATDDTPLDVEFYYDVDGEAGRHVAFMRTGIAEFDESPLRDIPNPNYCLEGNKRIPYLPCKTMYGLDLPSSRLPVSLVEAMLPAQIAVWESNAYIRKTLDVGAAWTEYEDGAYDDAEFKKYLDGEQGVALKRRSGKGPAIDHPAKEIPQTVLAYRADNMRELVAESGADPYASGAPVEGTNYAAEVNAIQGAAGLMAGVIAKDYSDLWRRIARDVLALGSIYDTAPCSIRLEDVFLEFDEGDQIKGYLRPDATPVVREDAMQYVDRKARMALALQDLNTAMQVAQMHPAAVTLAYRNYLRAAGHDNVDKWLEAPASPAQMMQHPTAQVAS